MPASKKRKGRGSGVPLSQRQHGSLEQMQARAAQRSTPKTDWGSPYEKPQAAAAAQMRADAPKRVTHVRPRRTGRNLAIGAGVVGAAAGTGYLVHRHNQKKAAMSKSLINPFEEVVVFGKAYPLNVTSGTDVQRVRALVPTGRHVSHANALKVVRRKARVSGRATRLERYTGGGISQKTGPFGKGLGSAARSAFGGAASRQYAGPARPSVQNGLRMIQDMPKLRTLPAAARGRNSNIPDGARRGKSLSRA